MVGCLFHRLLSGQAKLKASSPSIFLTTLRIQTLPKQFGRAKSSRAHHKLYDRRRERSCPKEPVGAVVREICLGRCSKAAGWKEDGGQGIVEEDERECGASEVAGNRPIKEIDKEYE